MSDEDHDSGSTAYDGRDDAFRTVFENRVRLQETDRQGIVFYGTYFTYQDEAIASYRRAIGFGGAFVDEADWTTRIVATDLAYSDSARFEDVLENEVRVRRIGETSITFDYRVCREADGRRLAEGTATQVVVDKATTEPRRVPASFRDAVRDFQGRE
ncbi:acyl-CoA thioesterase [Halovivax limisalsi]|uniref:acyl-CoA thioesterase n=1 Tax=Halovivax limisalsi TaxID=1453760 RepID=UPI001FFD2251|nr:thioesterase family protein [Halovivax limisalsi]